MTSLRMTVAGVPVGQGSMRAFVVAGKARVTHDNRPSLGVWRHAVTVTAAELWGEAAPLDEAVAVTLLFRLPRPASAPKRRIFPDRKPDLDKLSRAVLDSLTGVVLVDDARVVELRARKVYAVDAPPGAEVTVWAVDGEVA